MTPTEELLVEQVVSAHRERARDGSIRWSPAFFDLDTAGRAAAFETTVEQRAIEVPDGSTVIEAALDAEGFSTTVRALLGRLVRPG